MTVPGCCVTWPTQWASPLRVGRQNLMIRVSRESVHRRRIDNLSV